MGEYANDAIDRDFDIALRRGDPLGCGTLYFDFKGKLIRETPKAYLFLLEEGKKQEWFPKSRCSLNKAGNVLQCPDWLVTAKGLDIRNVRVVPSNLEGDEDLDFCFPDEY